MAYLLFFSIKLLYNSIPDELYVVEGEDTEISFSVPVSVEKEEESVERSITIEPLSAPPGS